jgi:Uma2 family endonuclease
MSAQGAAVAEKLYTVEEYFELDNNSEERYEFYNGKLILVPGEYKNANEIACNCTFHLRIAFKDKGYRIFQNDIRTVVKERKIYRYPDVVVAPKSDNSDLRHVLHPELIIEVLSESAESTDRNEKLKEYSALPSVKHYLLIEQDEMCVEMYSRDENDWRFSIYTQPEDVVPLTHLNCSLNLSDIYENIVFADKQSDE